MKKQNTFEAVDDVLRKMQQLQNGESSQWCEQQIMQAQLQGLLDDNKRLFGTCEVSALKQSLEDFDRMSEMDDMDDMDEMTEKEKNGLEEQNYQENFQTNLNTIIEKEEELLTSSNEYQQKELKTSIKSSPK